MKNQHENTLNLEDEDFSFICPLKIENMEEVEAGYFCGECKQKVHDVSGMTNKEYKSLVEKTEDICVTFKKVITVSLVLSLGACASPKEPKRILLGKIKPSHSTPNKDDNSSIELFENMNDKNKTISIKEPKLLRKTGKPYRKRNKKEN